MPGSAGHQADDTLSHRPSASKLAALTVAIVTLGQGVAVLSGRAPLLDGRLLDPDCYMHLQRARQMLVDGVCRLPVDGRIDAPYGGVLHWTSLFDLLLAGGAAVLLPLGLSPDRALWLWGSLSGPLLLLAALPVLAWGFRPVLPRLGLPLLAVLVLVQGQLSGAFLIGRPDHQNLLLAAFLVHLGCLAALLRGRSGKTTALAAGLIGGLALWCSVEGLLMLALTAATLALAWARGWTPGLLLLRRYAAAALAVLSLALLHERPEGSLLVSMARPSLVHWLALAGGVLSLVLAAPLEQRCHGLRPRLLLLITAATLALAPVSLLFPDFLRGPWGRLDGGLSLWHDEVEELKPLWPNSMPRLLSCAAQFLLPLAALPVVLRLRRRRAFMALVLAIPLFLVLALFQARWASYVQAAVLVPEAVAALWLWRRRPRLRTPLLAFLLLAQNSAAVLAQTLAAPRTAACDISTAARFLASERLGGAIVLADLYAGPEILWRSDARVIGGPYELAAAHRDTARLLHGDDTTARLVLIRRSVSQILLCRDDAKADGALATALRQGRSPPGLTPLWAPPGFTRHAVDWSALTGSVGASH